MRIVISACSATAAASAGSAGHRQTRSHSNGDQPEPPAGRAESGPGSESPFGAIGARPLLVARGRGGLATMAVLRVTAPAARAFASDSGSGSFGACIRRRLARTRGPLRQWATGSSDSDRPVATG